MMSRIYWTFCEVGSTTGRNRYALPNPTIAAKTNIATTTQTPAHDRFIAITSLYCLHLRMKKGRTVEGRKPCSLGGGGNEALL